MVCVARLHPGFKSAAIQTQSTVLYYEAPLQLPTQSHKLPIMCALVSFQEVLLLAECAGA